ncbi:BTAD domain-containing putative transcriptional regulator [Kutzneria sp. NPDC052558]|uniref:BTAD domain-containing putative transcriptional regulator n=1 Tax=Kutzneria sp. NPDC052558 TaxID=3364121 RepID=UPI0037C88665
MHDPAGRESASDQQLRFGVLGPVAAWADGRPLALKGPRHRAVLARLVLARRRVVPMARLVADLWEEPPARAVSAVQTFVGDLRRVLEPSRLARTPSRLLVTDGPGYALLATDVDAWEFESLAGSAFSDALALWRGPAYAEFASQAWATAERSRLAELRLQVVERLAGQWIAGGAAARAVPDLDAHVTEHPWREEGWRLLALALYQTGRQADALAVLRRARAMLADQLGLDPGPRLRQLEADVLAQDPRLDPAGLWTRAAEAYERTVAAGSRARLESTVGLLRTLAVTGGLHAAQEHRLAAVSAAEEFGDPSLTARVIGAYDVPAIWTRSDDPVAAARIVAAAERTLAVVKDNPAARCRLLTTIAVEMRGARSPRGPEAAGEAEEIARELGDPALLAFALNGRFLQSCTRAGLARQRDAIGVEVLDLATRHDLPTFAVLGHLIRVQARGALADFDTAADHAAAADHLAQQHELPLVGVFTAWFRAMRARSASAYRSAAELLHGTGMPGVEQGLLPLALFSLDQQADPDADWGPYRPWIEPFFLLDNGDRTAARDALHAAPEPPADLMYELLCCLQIIAARAVDDRPLLATLRARVAPAATELAGAGSGLVTLGPVAEHLS